jgi:hypothetical protein
MAADEIILTIPRGDEFQHVAQLVLGGVAARVNLSFESLDDLATALESLLERAERNGELTVALRVGEDAISAEVGPFHDGRLRSDLEQGPADDFGLRRILDTVVDEVAVGKRDGGDWVHLTKRFVAANGNP